MNFKVGIKNKRWPEPIILILSIVLIFIGCAWSLPDTEYPDFDFEIPGHVNWDDVGTNLLVTNTASALGYFVGKSGDPGIERLIGQHYQNIRNGRIDFVALNAGLDFIAQGNMDPLLGLLLNNTLTSIGATMVDGQLVKLDIPDEMWDKAEVAYQNGLLLGKMQLAIIEPMLFGLI